MKKLSRFLVAAASAFVVTTVGLGTAWAEYPERPVKVIVPYGAGGNTDTTARIFQKAFAEHDLLGQPLTVINVPGAGGSIGARQVKNAPADGYTILLYHVAMIAREASGASNFGYRDFDAIAGTADTCTVSIARPASGISSLKDLIEAGNTNPDSFLYGVNLGATSHIIGIMLQSQKPGTKFRFVQVGGDAKIYSSMKGGHINAGSISSPAYKKFKGEVKGLAYLGPKRHPDFPELPTAREQGVDITYCVQQWWLAPKGTPKAAKDRFAMALKKAMKTPDVKATFESRSAEATFVTGEEMVKTLPALYEKIAPFAKQAKKK